MRLTVFAIAMMPMAAFAQASDVQTPTQDLAQSCAVGTVWDGSAGACVAAPAQSMPAGGHSGCGMGAAREVMS